MPPSFLGFPPGRPCPPGPASDARFSDVSTGDLPCTDCTGIATKLYLYISVEDSLGHYRLQQTHVGTASDRNDASEQTGKYRVENGYAGNSTAILFRLEPSDPAKMRLFLKFNERELVSVNGNSQPDASDPRFILTKIGQESFRDSTRAASVGTQ